MKIDQVVSEEKVFKECGRRRTTEPYLSYKLTNEPSTMYYVLLSPITMAHGALVYRQNTFN